VGSTMRWKTDEPRRLWRELRLPAAVAVVLGIALPLIWGPAFHWQSALGIAIACWVLLVTLQGVRERLAGPRGLAGIPRGYWGMVLGHLGVAVFTVGITLASVYTVEKNIRMAPGDTFQLGGYTYTFHGVTSTVGPNYKAHRGHLTVTRDGREVTEMWPEKRVYNVQTMPMTEAAIDAGLTRDLFVALGDSLGDKGAWALRISEKPFVRWIWLGCLIMAFGGLLSASDRRYRLQARRSLEVPAGSALGRA